MYQCSLTVPLLFCEAKKSAIIDGKGTLKRDYIVLPLGIIEATKLDVNDIRTILFLLHIVVSRDKSLGASRPIHKE
jgi:hypothetical protein